MQNFWCSLKRKVCIFQWRFRKDWCIFLCAVMYLLHGGFLLAFIESPRNSKWNIWPCSWNYDIAALSSKRETLELFCSCVELKKKFAVGEKPVSQIVGLILHGIYTYAKIRLSFIFPQCTFLILRSAVANFQHLWNNLPLNLSHLILSLLHYLHLFVVRRQSAP